MEILLLISSVLSATFVVDLLKGSSQCFKEIVSKGDRVEIGYSVIQAVNEIDSIDLTVLNTDGSTLHSVQKEKATAFGFTAVTDQTYTICLINTKSDSDKQISLTITTPEELSLIQLAVDYSG
jgi:hypothetical protein